MKKVASALTILFALFVYLSLTTPSWRYGPFSWVPLYTFEHLAGGPMSLGILNLLPLALALLWLGAERKQAAWTWGPRVVTLPLALFTAWALFCLIGAPFRLLFIYGGGFAIMWLTYLFYVNRRPPLGSILVPVIFVQGVVGCLQFALQHDLGLAALGELPLNPAFEGVTVLRARGEPWLRAYGLTAHPNLYGALLAVGLLLMVVTRERGDHWRPFVFLAAFLVGLAGLFFSFSRSAWLAAAISGLFWAALAQPQTFKGLRRPNLWLLIPLMLVALALISYGDLIVSRFTNLEEPIEAQSINQRFSDARLALQLARQNPLLGVGLGNNVEAASAISQEAGRVHNVLLLSAAELGLPGLILAGWLLLAPFAAYWSLLRSGKRAMTASGLSPWLLVVIVNQFDTTLWMTGNWQTAILFALAAGNAAVYLWRASTAPTHIAERAEAVHGA